MIKRKYINEAEDSFGIESMQELIDKNVEELENTKLALEKAEEDKKNTGIQANVEKNTATRMPSTNNPTDKTSMDKIGMEASVNKKKPLYAKREQELDDQIKNLSDRIKYLEDTIKTQKKTLDDMKRVEVSEHRIIKAKDFKSIVENYTKISLSESEIMSILVESQNPVMTKSELVESIQNNLIIEARMNPNVSRSFDSGDNEYAELLGSDIAKQMADQAFADIARNIQQKTGRQNVSLEDVQQLLMSSLIEAAKKEYQYGIERLERKAVELVSKKFNVPSGSVNFDVKITGLPPQLVPVLLPTSGLNRQQMMEAMNLAQNPTPQNLERLSEMLRVRIGMVEKEGMSYEKGNTPPPQGKTAEQMKPKVKRRRLTNAMMQGSARLTQNLHFADDDFRDENPDLSREYGKIMAANDANYWLMDDDTIKREGQGGIHAGNSRVKLSQTGGVPTIVAQGMTYPILLHELGKGIPELMSLWSLPTDPEERKYVLSQTDNLEAETNDIRLGPALWTKFIEEIPVENQEVVSLTWHKLQELSDYDFNSIVEGLLQNRTDAKNKIKMMAEEAIEELREEGSDEALGVYGGDEEEDEEGDVATPEAGEEKEGEYTDPVLKKLLGGDEEEDEGPQETGNLEDMSKDQLVKLMQSAIEDEDYEFASQIRDILNNR